MSANKKFVKKEFISNLGERAAKVNERTDDELLKLREMKISLAKEIESLRDEKEQIVRIKEALEIENKNLERNTDVLRTELEKQNNSIDTNTKEIQGLTELRENLNLDVDRLRSVVENLKGEENILIENQKQLQVHSRDLEAEIEKLNKEQNFLNDELKKLNEFKSLLLSETAALAEEKEKLNSDIQNLKYELSLLKEKQEEATLQLTITMKEVNEKILKVEELNMNIIELEKGKEQGLVDLKEVENRLVQFNEEKEIEQSALKLIVEQASDVRKDIEEMEKQRLILQSDIKTLEDRIGGLNPYQIPDDIKVIALEEVKTTIFLPRIDKDVLKFQAQVNKGDMKIELPQLLRSGLNKKYYEILEKVYREQVNDESENKDVEHN